MPNLSKRETATILAALRHYQDTGLADKPELRSEAVHEIATDAGQLLASMCGEEVEALCERLNFDDSDQWSSTDQETAMRAGWFIANDDTAPEIQRDDEGGAFMTDDAARAHVAGLAIATPGGLHAKAIAYIYQRMQELAR